MLALLEDTPRRLAACTAGQKAAALAAKPNPKGWSAAEHLGHVRACAEVWGFTIFAMLVAEHPALPNIHPRQWAKVKRLTKAQFGPGLQVFALERGEFLSRLRGLPDAAWERTADIGGRTHSVFTQVRRMALHEEQHCEQVEALFG